MSGIETQQRIFEEDFRQPVVCKKLRLFSAMSGRIIGTMLAARQGKG
jgi:hypothetical protein